MADVKITDNSKQVLAGLNANVARALEAVGLTVEAYAKLNCPVDTGRLRGSITHEVEESKKVVHVGTNVEYAP